MVLSCGPIGHDLRLGHGQHHRLGDPPRGRRGGANRQTLDNIEALISADNLARHGMPGLGATLEDLAGIRVYIKRQEDYEKTREVCEPGLGELPAIYAIADVCRPELLVEIEGVALSRAG